LRRTEENILKNNVLLDFNFLFSIFSLVREQERESYDIENMSPLQSPRNAAVGGGPQSPMMSPYGGGGLSPYGSPNDPNGTSMGINTQKFLMLFLVCPAPKTMTLEFAARVIHGERGH
jgi:hypothetical protein